MSPDHICEKHLQEYEATAERPYQYVGSGLPNVYLVGVKYTVCSVCESQSAEIPALAELLKAIAQAIVEKTSSLNGAEVRFLRKNLERKSMDFASLIGVEPQTLSRMEGTNEALPVERGRDRLIRLVYRVLSGDAKLKDAPADRIERWLTSIQGTGDGERIVATWLRNHQWRVEREQLAA